MGLVKKKFKRNMFFGHYKQDRAKLTHELLFQLLYSDHLDHLSFLVWCCENEKGLELFDTEKKNVSKLCRSRYSPLRTVLHEAMASRIHSNHGFVDSPDSRIT